MNKQEITIQVKEKSKELGFDLVGITKPHIIKNKLLDVWLSKNNHASMQWIKNRSEERKNIYSYFPEIKSHRIEGWNNAREAASKYENEIKSIIKKKNGIPQLDLIFMGMGEDGHVASIFPENEDHNSLDCLVEDIYVESKSMYRVTMTLQILNNSKNRIIGILGDKKRMIFNNLLNSNYKNYPIAKLLSSNSKDTWILY